MIFSHNNQKKYFNKYLLKRPGHICILLLLFSFASIIVEEIELIFLEKMENHIYKNKTSTSDQELFLIVSSVERRNNEIDIFVTVAKPDYTVPGEEVFDAPVDTETTTGEDEFFSGAELVKAYMHNRAINQHNSRDNNLDPSESTGNVETDIISNLGLTPEGKLGLIALLKTLTYNYELAEPQSVQK